MVGVFICIVILLFLKVNVCREDFSVREFEALLWLWLGVIIWMLVNLCKVFVSVCILGVCILLLLFSNMCIIICCVDKFFDNVGCKIICWKLEMDFYGDVILLILV